MVVVDKKLSWLRLLFTLSGTTLQDSWPRIASSTLFALAVTVADKNLGLEHFTLTVAPFALTGVAISIFLGFRNNTAYDRFWEARTLWGALINHCRSLTRQVLTLTRASDELKRELVYYLIAFAHALRHHLRGTSPWEEIAPLVPGELEGLRRQQNVPNGILLALARRLADGRTQGWVNDFHANMLESSLVELTNVQGGSERIRNTPIPFPYAVLSHRVVAFYCFFLPLGLVDTVGWFTPIVVFLVSHAFFGLDVLGEEIEDPFGTSAHNLPLAHISLTIELNLRQMLGETQVPPLPQPVAGVLL